jgi:hypothetical protein
VLYEREREKTSYYLMLEYTPQKKWIDIRVSLFPLSSMIDDKHLRFLPFRLIWFPFSPRRFMNDACRIAESHHVIRYFFLFFVEEYVQF